jgi:hypothetical protein
MSDGYWAVLDGFHDPIVLQAKIPWRIFATRSATWMTSKLGSEQLNRQYLS